MSSLIKNHLNFQYKSALISHQSLAGFSIKWNLGLENCFAVLTSFFKVHFGFDLVLDIFAFVHLVNVYANKEFEERQNLKFNSNEKISKNKDTIICSECPGWICYLEKVLGEDFVPFASKIKPPQMIQADFIKKYVEVNLGIVL